MYALVFSQSFDLAKQQCFIFDHKYSLVDKYHTVSTWIDQPENVV